MAVLISTAVSEKRHGLNLPTAVSLSLLQEVQKQSLIALMNPIMPRAPSNL
jgi:hypothetical protein